VTLDGRLRVQRALRDRYRLGDELGRGAMGIVFRATDLKSGDDVALKVLLPAVDEPQAVDRFTREMELAQALRHDNIVTVLDAGNADGLPYYAMTFVGGGTMRERMAAAGRLTAAEAATVGAQTAAALAFAHARDIVHRDIKPENLLRDGDRIVVADFGVGKALSAPGASSLTGTGFTVGTPTYMSPEQAAGDRQLDGRSDLYSLGVVLYEMLAGEVPFNGRTPQQIIAARFLTTPPALRDRRPDVPGALADEVHALLALEPDARPRDASDVAARLRQAAAAA
jgi:serine/threonine protein kinase